MDPVCCTADGSFWSNKNAEQTHCTAKLMVALGECTMTLYIHCAWGGEKQIFYDLLYIRHSSGLDLKSISVVHSSAHLDLRQNSAPLLDTSLQVNETSFSQQASNETRCGEKLSGAVDQDWSSLGNAFSWIRMGVYEGDLPGDPVGSVRFPSSLPSQGWSLVTYMKIQTLHVDSLPPGLFQSHRP